MANNEDVMRKMGAMVTDVERWGKAVFVLTLVRKGRANVATLSDWDSICDFLSVHTSTKRKGLSEKLLYCRWLTNKDGVLTFAHMNLLDAEIFITRLEEQNATELCTAGELTQLTQFPFIEYGSDDNPHSQIEVFDMSDFEDEEGEEVPSTVRFRGRDFTIEQFASDFGVVVDGVVLSLERRKHPLFGGYLGGSIPESEGQ